MKEVMPILRAALSQCIIAELLNLLLGHFA